MDNRYIFIQPEYYGRFQCDGQRCGSKCCQKWLIPIDKVTYKKYAGMKPKSVAKEILSHVRLDEHQHQHVISLAEDGWCPFLTEGGWCSLQRRYGEGMLSMICRTYPRVLQHFDGYYERALLMTCPVAADLITASPEPMAFEQVELSKDEVKHCADLVMFQAQVPHELMKYFFTVQYTAISILQARNLSIDGRLIVLGFYIDLLDELISGARFDEIDNISAIYSSEAFLNAEARRLIAGVEFSAEEYIKKMFGLLDAIYGGNSGFLNIDRRFIDAIRDTLAVIGDRNHGVPFSKLAENYRRLSPIRQAFIEKHSACLEHYLVNDFFVEVYPWKTAHSIIQNYGSFVSTYKILELCALSIEVQCRQLVSDSDHAARERLLATIVHLSENINHNPTYEEIIINRLDHRFCS